MAAAATAKPAPEATRQVPVQKKPAEARPVIPPAPAASSSRPEASGRSPGRSQAAAPAAALPPLPTVRRGGYDKDAVDARLRQLAADHTEFGQRAARAESRISELETALVEARSAQEPSYAGLGGRASAMLRLAEEEAAEMRLVAQRDADEIREQATRDAQAVKADASRDAEELRIVHTKELDDHRARLMTEAEQERSNAKSETADLMASAQREADQLRLGGPAGGQRAAHRRRARGGAVQGRPWTARSRRPGGCSPWTVSGWPARPPSTTQRPREPSAWSRRPRAGRRPPRRGRARRCSRPPRPAARRRPRPRHPDPRPARG